MPQFITSWCLHARRRVPIEVRWCALKLPYRTGQPELGTSRASRPSRGERDKYVADGDITPGLPCKPDHPAAHITCCHRHG
jgi:hypothetical protein